MENMNGIEQEINRKKRYMEIQEENITKHMSYIEKLNLQIAEIEKCKCLKDLWDYNNIYAYNGEKYICYEVGEGSIDNVYTFDNFDELKDFAKRYYLTLIGSSNKEIEQSNALIEKIKGDIDKLKKILLGMVNNI